MFFNQFFLFWTIITGISSSSFTDPIFFWVVKMCLVSVLFIFLMKKLFMFFFLLSSSFYILKIFSIISNFTFQKSFLFSGMSTLTLVSILFNKFWFLFIEFMIIVFIHFFWSNVNKKKFFFA